jgi:hypothetical protein
MTDAPIIVSATPNVAMWQTALRYAITAIAAVLAALGYTGAAGKASALLLAVGPVAAFLAFLWGLRATSQNGKKLAILADAAPDNVAQIRNSPNAGNQPATGASNSQA